MMEQAKTMTFVRNPAKPWQSKTWRSEDRTFTRVCNGVIRSIGVPDSAGKVYMTPTDNVGGGNVFRVLLSNFPQGACIVTIDTGHGMFGATANGHRLYRFLGLKVPRPRSRHSQKELHVKVEYE